MWVCFIATLAAMILDLKLRNEEVLGKSYNSLQTQPSTKCLIQKQKFDHGTKKMKKLSIASSSSLNFTD